MLFRERQLMNPFKPGDWVIASKVCKKPKKFTIIAKLKKIKSVSTYAYPYILEDGNYCETVKLWQPKEGEWVVIADDITPDLYAVFQFNNHSKDGQILPLAFLQTLKDQS